MSNVISEPNQNTVNEIIDMEVRDRQLNHRLAMLAKLGDTAVDPAAVSEHVDVPREPAHMAKKVKPLGVLKAAKNAVIKSTSTPPAHRIR
jgi:hypothetical protein